MDLREWNRRTQIHQHYQREQYLPARRSPPPSGELANKSGTYWSASLYEEFLYPPYLKVGR